MATKISKRVRAKHRVFNDGHGGTWVRQEPIANEERAQERAEHLQCEVSWEVQRLRKDIARKIGFNNGYGAGFPPPRQMCIAVATPRDGEVALLNNNQITAVQDGDSLIGEIEACWAAIAHADQADDGENAKIYLMGHLGAHVAELRVWWSRMHDALRKGKSFASLECKYRRAQRLRAELDAYDINDLDQLPAPDPDAKLKTAWRELCKTTTLLWAPSAHIEKDAVSHLRQTVKVTAATIEATPAHTAEGRIVKRRAAVLAAARDNDTQAAMIHEHRIKSGAAYEAGRIQPLIESLNAELDGTAAGQAKRLNGAAH